MAVVAAPAYLASREPIEHPRDLVRHRCINYRMASAGTLYAWEFDRDGEALDVSVTGPLTFSAPELMLDAALDGLGVGYLVESEVAAHLADGRLTRRLEEWTPPFPGFHLYYPSRREMRALLAAFINATKARSQ